MSAVQLVAEGDRGGTCGAGGGACPRSLHSSACTRHHGTTLTLLPPQKPNAADGAGRDAATQLSFKQMLHARPGSDGLAST